MHVPSCKAQALHLVAIYVLVVGAISNNIMALYMCMYPYGVVQCHSCQYVATADYPQPHTYVQHTAALLYVM